MLDCYYGAKAMTLFRTLVVTGEAVPAVFWHTGGAVAALTSLAGDAA